MGRRDDGQREDWIELADEDLEEPTVIDEFDPGKAATPTVSMGICHSCGGPCGTLGPRDPMRLPEHCLASQRRRWFWCAPKRLVGYYVP